MKSEARSRHKPLGEILLEDGTIEHFQLAEALAYKRHHGIKLGQALVELNLATEAQLTSALQRQGKIHCIRLSPDVVERDAAALLGEEASRHFNSIAINTIAGVTTVAVEDPGDVYTVDSIAMKLGTRVFAVHAEARAIERCIDHVFGGGAPTGTTGPIEISEDEDEATGGLLREVLEAAVRELADEVHFEPTPADVLVRFRSDGNLHENRRITGEDLKTCVTQLKRLAGLDMTQRLFPQDNRTSVVLSQNRHDVRVATAPTLHGEGAVVRIESGHAELLTLGDLDLLPRQLEDLRKIGDSRNGLVLVTGPEEGGKMTTIYALVQEIDLQRRKVVTLEDPVEGVLEGVTQIRANPSLGLTYATALPSILQQSPDVVVIGALPDLETARAAISASQGGRLVYSTFPCWGSAETVLRMLDLGVEPRRLAETLRGIVFQRLLRKLCTKCRVEAEADPEVAKRLGIRTDDTTYFIGAGCEECRNTGYRGRLGVYEVLRVTPAIAAMIAHDASAGRIQEHARSEGLVTMKEHALARARAGETSLEEVLVFSERG